MPNLKVIYRDVNFNPVPGVGVLCSPCCTMKTTDANGEVNFPTVPAGTQQTITARMSDGEGGYLVDQPESGYTFTMPPNNLTAFQLWNPA